jgi:Zn-dependent M16 (insulinase) family peptidase
MSAGAGQEGAFLSRLLEALPQGEHVAERHRPEIVAATPLADSALVVSSQVNHCVIAWSVPGMQNPDSPALAVGAELISNTILHRRLREKGGAYGGSAAYAERDGVFTMSSFRDPRLAGTYADFDAALTEMAGADVSEETLEEAIICVIKRLDKPLSPSAQAMHAWNLDQRGVTQAEREAFRRGVLGCGVEQVKAALARWLKTGSASRAAAVGNSDQDLAGLKPIDLLALARPVPSPEAAR